MPFIPLPTGVTGSERLPRTRRSLTNCFNDGQGHILSRPGIEALNTTGLVARGQFVWNGSIYQVVSNSLIKITDTDTGTFTTNGTAITGNANIDSAFGFNTNVTLVPSGDIFTLDKLDNVVLISGGSNFVPSVSVAHINGRFVYIPSDGDPAFFSDVGAAGTVQSSSFFDAEELPDENKVTFNLNNTLYIGGTDSFELFRDTGASPNPFTRINGARISAGYIGGLIEGNGTFYFIGRLKDQGFGIFAIGQGTAPKISNTVIDLILTTYSEAELSVAIGNRLNWRGFDIITFTLGSDSFGYFNGEWFFLETLVDGVPSIWKGGFINQFQGEYFTASESNIGKLARINTDYGGDVSKIIDVGFEQEDGDFMTCANVGLSISQGFSSGGGTVGLSMSRDNVNYGTVLFREVGAIGEYSQKLEWNEAGGLGMYDGFMGMRFQTTQDIDFAVDKMYANFR